MNILFIVPYVPTAIRTRPYNLLRELARRGHVITLATLSQSRGEREALHSLEQNGISVLAEQLARLDTARNSIRAVIGRAPIQAAYCWQSSLAKRIEQVVCESDALTEGRFDIVHVEHLRGARYGLPLTGQIPTLWDSVDCISYLLEQASRYSIGYLARWMTRFELLRTRRFEGWLVHQRVF